MRTHGHREGSTTHLGLLGGMGRDSGGSWGGIAWGEMPDVGEGEGLGPGRGGVGAGAGASAGMWTWE